MRFIVIKLRFAVGSRVCMIADASEICGIIQMGASSLGGLSITSLLATRCSSLFGGARMALIALARLFIIRQPLGVPAAVSVAVVNSLVSALRCAFGLRLGGNVAGRARPILKFGMPLSSVQSTNCIYSGQPKALNTMHLFLSMPTIRGQPGLRI